MTRIVFIGGGEPLSLTVQEDLAAVVAAMRGTAEFRRFTASDGRLRWVNSAAVAYVEEDDVRRASEPMLVSDNATSG
jgi:hypothetical protein